MVILFAATSLFRNRDGVGTYTSELISQMALSKPNVKFIGVAFKSDQKKSSLLPSSHNIKFMFLPFNRKTYMSLLCIVRWPIDRFLPVKSGLFIFPNFVTAPWVSKKFKKIVTVHDLCYIDCPQYVSTWNRKFLKNIVPKSLKQADLIVAVSEFTKSRIQRIYQIPSEKIYVMYNPPIQPSKPDNEIIERNDLKNYLLFVGTLEPRKNIGTLLTAYSQLPKNLQNNYPLVLTGSKGWKDEDLTAQLNQLQSEGHNIILTGYVTDSERSALYQQATACIFPSHYEGFGIPILEAMGHGKPVVCSDIEVFHEVGESAPLFFDKDDPINLANLLTELLKDPGKLRAMGIKSAKRFSSYPTWQQIANDFYSYVSQHL